MPELYRKCLRALSVLPSSCQQWSNNPRVLAPEPNTRIRIITYPFFFKKKKQGNIEKQLAFNGCGKPTTSFTQSKKQLTHCCHLRHSLVSVLNIVILLKYEHGSCLQHFPVGFHTLHHSKTGTKDDFFHLWSIMLASVVHSFTEEAIFIHILKKSFWGPSNRTPKKYSLQKAL